MIGPYTTSGPTHKARSGGAGVHGAVTGGRRFPDGYPAGTVTLMGMSKRTSRQKASARRKKANHGRKPNLGRNS